ELADCAPIDAWPKPAQQPHPPIFVGGESPAALERLRLLGDGWLPRAKTSTAELRRVRDWLAEQGRDDVTMTFCGTPRDREVIESVIAAGVERISFTLPTAQQSQTRRDLDALAALIQPLR